MFRPTEWGSFRTTTPRRLIAVSALALTTVAVTSLPAAACDDGTRASASVLSTRTTDGVGYSEADWPHNAGPNTSGPITTIPASDYLDFGQGGGMQSVSSATSETDASALSGFVGSDGTITFDRTSGRFAPATIDLLALMRKGGADLSDALVDEATLRLGIGGSELVADGGRFLDPDGVGGPGQYRVGQADLDLHSPKVAEAAAMMYDAAGTMDRATEEFVNKTLSLPSVSGTSLTARISSNMKDRVFKAILAEPITSKNKVLTVDFSTGRATLHFDQALHGMEVNKGIVTGTQVVRPGDPTGLNSQNPNTELLDSEIYPMIAETVHDLMDEVLTIAVRAAQGALSSVTAEFTAKQADSTGTAVATWTVNLGTGKVSPAQCTATGLTGNVKCVALTSLVNTVIAPVSSTALVPVRDALLGEGGATLYRLAIADLKTGLITVPVRAAVEPIFLQVTKFVSLKLNAQKTFTCVAADGSRRLAGVDLSAVRLSSPAAGVGVGLGNSSVSLRCVGTLQ